MKIEPISSLMFVGGISFLAYAVYVALRPGETLGEEEGKGRIEEEKPSPPDNVSPRAKQGNTTLAAIASGWAIKKPVGIICLAEVAKLWKPELTTGKLDVPTPPFTNPEILRFWLREVEDRQTVKGNTKALIAKILEILDTQGNCSSVVDKNQKDKDKESGLGKELYARLATIPLWEHTLGVAREMINRTKQPMLIPDAIVVGLAHDLGKISAYQNAYYRTGDHPTLSIIVLSGIDEFKKMKNREELQTVVRDHHTQNATETPLLRMLKEADANTRFEEIARIGSDPDLVVPPSPQVETPKKKKKASLEKSAKSVPVSAPIVAPLGVEGQKVEEPAAEVTTEAPPVILDTEKEPVPDSLQSITVPLLPEIPVAPVEVSTPLPPEFISIPQFLSPVPKGDPPSSFGTPVLTEQGIDPNKILMGLKPLINKFQGSRWAIIAMQDGFVYVPKEVVWKVVAENYPDHPQVTSAIITGTAKDLIFLNLMTAWVEAGRIQNEWISLKKGFVTARVVIVSPEDRRTNAMMIPFHLYEAFGMRLNELKYTPLFRKLIKEVIPVQYKEKR